MDEELPDNFDVIVFGTGMVESIVAAAVARAGKTVLHMDVNGYYGQLWATLSIDGIQEWINSFNKCIPINNENALKPENEFHCVHKVDFTWFKPTKISDEIDSEDSVVPVESSEKIPKEDQFWSMTKIKASSNKFNLDLSPKIIYSTGPMVELLIQSRVSRYTEFLSVLQILTYIDSHIEKVPCSKSDVFTSKTVTMIEKRKLMKIFNELMDNPENIDGTTTFYEYLKKQDLPENLIHYVLYSVADASKVTSFEKAVENSRLFLKNIGHYGNSPFLWPLYGSSELLQAFCRLAAVFGGIYYLKRDISNVILDENKIYEGILSNDKKIKSSHFVSSMVYFPKYCKVNNISYICRFILLTDSSIFPQEKEGVSLLRLPSESGAESISVLELGPSSHSSPKGIYTVHLFHKNKNKSFDELIIATNKLFNRNDILESSNHELFSNSNKQSGKPTILYSVHFLYSDTSNWTQYNLSSNIHLCHGPNLSIDFSSAVQQAKDIFTKMYPDDEFLEPTQDPNEVQFDEQNQDFNDDQTVPECDNMQNKEKNKGDVEKLDFINDQRIPDNTS